MSRKRKQSVSDDDISVMLKNRIAEVLDPKKKLDVNTLVQVTNAFAKLRSVEIKADEDDFGSELTPAETAPDDLNKVLRQ